MCLKKDFFTANTFKNQNLYEICIQDPALDLGRDLKSGNRTLNNPWNTTALIKQIFTV